MDLEIIYREKKKKREEIWKNRGPILEVYENLFEIN